MLLTGITFANSLHQAIPRYGEFKSHNFSSNLIYALIVLSIAITLGLRGNMDEYSKFYILMPNLGEFIGNFEFYNEETRFKYVNNTGNTIAYEKGYFFALIVSILKSLNLTSQSILIFFSSTSVLIHGYYFYKFTPYAFIALLFYISHELILKEWISIRQALVSAFILPSIYFVVNNKKIKFYSLFIFGTLIQYINILSLVLIFLNRRLSRGFIIFVLFLALFIHFSDLTRIILLNDYVKMIFPSFITNYLISDIHGKSISIINPKLLQQITLIFLLVANYKRFSQLSNELKYFNILFNTYFVGTILMIIFTGFSIFAYRFNGHFYVVEPILITYLIWYFRPKFIIVISIICLCLVFSYLNYVHLERLTPYQFLIQINSLYLIK